MSVGSTTKHLDRKLQPWKRKPLAKAPDRIGRINHRSFSHLRPESRDANLLILPRVAAYGAGRESFHAIYMCHIDLGSHRNHDRP